MKTEELKYKIGGRYQIQKFMQGTPVIGEVIDVDKYYLLDFVARDGERSRGWFKEKDLTPVADPRPYLGMMVGNIIPPPETEYEKHLYKSFVKRLRAEGLIKPAIRGDGPAIAQAVGEMLANTRRLDDFVDVKV